jgi:glyoxylase-like metal-dependent hydrolase (beta-lactamase superfamily II)
VRRTGKGCLSYLVGSGEEAAVIDAAVSYPFSPLGDGGEVRRGEARLGTLRTPGHTAEDTSYLPDAKALFTGDTLFLSAVARPDLEASPEGAREKARALHGSLRRVLALDGERSCCPGIPAIPSPSAVSPSARRYRRCGGARPC